MPGDFQAAVDMKPKYSLLLDDDGGIIDDLMATRRGDDFYVVVNGATKHGDIEVLGRRLPRRCGGRPYEGAGAARAPGPARRRSAGRPGRRGLASSASCRPARSTGGATISGSAAPAIRARTASRFRCRPMRPRRSPTHIAANDLLPLGLGVRDLLRLEAGLPLYGHDLDLVDILGDGRPQFRRSTSAAGPKAVSPDRLRILAELQSGPAQKRVGFEVDGRQPVREGALILDGEGNELGKITSGGFSPSLQRPIAMGYVATPLLGDRDSAQARAARQAVRRVGHPKCRSSLTVITAREPPDEPVFHQRA